VKKSFLALTLLVSVLAAPVRAQQLDLSHGGPVAITATDGIEWRQDQRKVIARGNARAVRGNVTVTADQLIAYYRPKDGATPAAPATPQPTANLPGTDADTGGNEIYRLEALGNVHIFTPTDQAQGDRAIYDIDQAVLVMTGHDLKLTTPSDVLTARDTMEYWSQKHMAVARGDAVVVTNDGKRMTADTLVAYTTDAQQPPAGATPVAAKAPATPADSDDPLAASGKLQKVDAFGNVTVRTPTDTAVGDRAVYVPDTGIARLAGKVRITRGQNQLDGTEAEVNMKTGISRLLSQASGGVHGLVVPNDSTNKQLGAPGSPTAAPAGKSK
jgi:lipopolysaccharide export system protein LptA